MPTTADLAVLLQLLARSGDRAAAHASTRRCSPGRAARARTDGPEELHVVILDNGRTNLLRGALPGDARLHPLRRLPERLPGLPQDGRRARTAPVYSGPMGAVLAAAARRARARRRRCRTPRRSAAPAPTACPVKIPLHELLLDLRRDLVEEGVAPWWERLGFTLWSCAWSSPLGYRLSTRWRGSGSRSPGSPGPGASWARGRDAAAVRPPLPGPRDERAASTTSSRTPRRSAATSTAAQRRSSRAPASRRRSTASPTRARSCSRRRRTSRARDSLLPDVHVTLLARGPDPAGARRALRRARRRPAERARDRHRPEPERRHRAEARGRRPRPAARCTSCCCPRG